MKKLLIGLVYLSSVCWLVMNIVHGPKVQVRGNLERKVRVFFRGDPVLVDIAKCESNFTHWNKHGRVYRGEVNKHDVGIMQINTQYHGREAARLGLDLKSLEGNLAYAKYLYDHEGTRPWNSSAHCWVRRQSLFSRFIQNR